MVRSDLFTALPVQEDEPNTRSVTSPVTMLHPAVTSDVTTQQVLQFYRDNPSASYVTAASHLNITRQTVSRHVSRLRRMENYSEKVIGLLFLINRTTLCNNFLKVFVHGCIWFVMISHISIFSSACIGVTGKGTFVFTQERNVCSSALRGSFLAT